MQTIYLTLKPIRHFCIIFCASLLLLAGCTSYIPREDLRLSSTGNPDEDKIKLVTIPLPVIASSPNEGITYGGLTAFLAHNRKDEITTLLAPQVNYNDTFGVTASLYGAFYPSSEQSWEVNFSKSTKVNEDYEIKLRDKSLLERKLELNAFLFNFTDGSARFFGFEAKTKRERETNYADNEFGTNLSAGYDIGHHIQLVLGERFRKVSIDQGAVTGVPFIRTKFSEQRIPGINGFTTQALRISLAYSTLDNRDTPTFGGYTRISFEPTFKALGGAGDYRHYEVEAKGYIPLSNARYITVFRLMYNQTLGPNVPFLEQSILGERVLCAAMAATALSTTAFFSVILRSASGSSAGRCSE